MQRQQPAAQEIPVLDRVNQDLLDHLATEKGPPIYPLTPRRGTQCSIAGAVRRRSRSQTTRSNQGLECGVESGHPSSSHYSS